MYANVHTQENRVHSGKYKPKKKKHPESKVSSNGKFINSNPRMKKITTLSKHSSQ